MDSICKFGRFKEEGSTYKEDFSYEGRGTVNLAVIDRDGNIIRNGALASGDITKHYPYTSSADNKIVVSWIDGDDVKLSFIETNPEDDLLMNMPIGDDTQGWKCHIKFQFFILIKIIWNRR